MKGLSGMMASMLGMTPEEIEEAVTEVKTALFAMAEGVGKIHAQNVAIHETQLDIVARLERIENGSGKRKSPARIGNDSGSKPGDGDGGSAGNTGGS